MKSMSTFQMIVIAIFVLLTMIGVGVFAAFGGMLGGTPVGQVVIWGVADSNKMSAVIETLRSTDKSFQDVSYIQKDARTFDSELVNAIAAGAAPDLFLLTQEQLGIFANKIVTIPYSTVSQSTFANAYIDEGTVFLNGSGAWALPLMVDPLVMYFNRDLLSTAGVAQAPQFWNELLTLAPKITSLDSSQNVQRSAVALGTWENVSHAQAILSTLFIQAGDPIVTRNAQGVLVSTLGQAPVTATENPATSALRFYTEFANPSKTSYSWNRSLPNSTSAFAAGDVAVYFGFASELQAIAERNPNLRFGVAVVPQLAATSNHATYGLLTGVAIPRMARNQTGALMIAQKLSSQAGVRAVAAVTGLPSVRRDVGIDTSNSASAQVFAQSALISRGWFNPNRSATEGIFRAMVQSVTTGSSDPGTAVNEAAQEFATFFR